MNRDTLSQFRNLVFIAIGAIAIGTVLIAFWPALAGSAIGAKLIGFVQTWIGATHFVMDTALSRAVGAFTLLFLVLLWLHGRRWNQVKSTPVRGEGATYVYALAFTFVLIAWVWQPFAEHSIQHHMNIVLAAMGACLAMLMMWPHSGWFKTQFVVILAICLITLVRSHNDPTQFRFDAGIDRVDHGQANEQVQALRSGGRTVHKHAFVFPYRAQIPWLQVVQADSQYVWVDRGSVVSLVGAKDPSMQVHQDGVPPRSFTFDGLQRIPDASKKGNRGGAYRDAFIYHDKDGTTYELLICSSPALGSDVANMAGLESCGSSGTFIVSQPGYLQVVLNVQNNYPQWYVSGQGGDLKITIFTNQPTLTSPLEPALAGLGS